MFGSSHLVWIGGALVIDVDETTTPGGEVIRGRVTVHPEIASPFEAALDARGEHRWWPVAPLARVEVDFPSPGIRFAGRGYHDANSGASPLDVAFARWSWSRAHLPDGEVVVMYDAIDRAGRARPLALRFDRRSVRTLDGVPRLALPATRWGLERSIAGDPAHPPRIVRTLDDGPCYARSLVRTRVFGQDVTAVHEVLSGDRLRRAWVRALLGFRIASEP